MKIIITMAGEGSRFKEVGYNKPKHEIQVKGKTLFEWSMLSLKDFFDYEFIFISRDKILDRNFLENMCLKIGINNYSIVLLEQKTDGQATTAYKAKDYINDNDSVIIYNIDTYVREYKINRDQIKDNYDGFIPVVKVKGDKWSFVKVNENGDVIEVAEKEPISDLATVGFYYFNSWKDYVDIYINNSEKIKKENKEKYIAPMYQEMITDGKNISINILENEDVHILGTPEELKEFNSK